MLGFGKKRGRKAQITVFLIIGLVLLISSGIFFYLKEIGVGDYKILQPKSAPVDNYVDACLQRVGREALDLAGAQGGFVDFPPEIQYDPSRYVFLVPPIAGTASFAPKVPLWWADGTLKYPKKILASDGINRWLFTESEVDRYVEQNMRNCLNNFDPLRNEFDFIEYTDITAFTTFNENDVSIRLIWELDVIHRGSEKVTRKTEFVSYLSVKFRKMMDAAEEIAEAAVQQMFFEEVTFNLMATFPDDPPDGIPFTGVMFKCGTLHWNMFSIRERLMDALRIVMTGVRFDDTEHLPFIGKEKEYEKFRAAFQEITTISNKDLDSMPTSQILFKGLGVKTLDDLPPSDSYEYFQLFFDFTDNKKRYKDFIIGAEYRQDYSMDFLAIPSSNGMMRSSVADFRHQIMSLLCMNYYHFIYRVRFPIVITIQDPDAYNDEGAWFKFAYLVTIANNEPDKQPRPAEFFEPTDVAPDFCDPINRNGLPVEIVALDKTTGLEINHVNISYQCFQSRCYLGETKTNNRRFQLSATLPEGCSRGVVIAEKPGYLTKQEQRLVSPMYIQMYPTINLSYQVMKRRSQSLHIARFLEHNEHAAIQIKSKDPPYDYFIDYTEENKFNLSHSIELVRSDDVTYDLDIYLFKTVGGDDILTGGWQGNWTPSLSSLKDADKLTLQAVQVYPVPNNMDPDKMVAVFDLMSNRSNYPDVNPETIAIPITPVSEEEQTNTTENAE